jgi:chromosome segregation ATPase
MAKLRTSISSLEKKLEAKTAAEVDQPNLALQVARLNKMVSTVENKLQSEKLQVAQAKEKSTAEKSKTRAAKRVLSAQVRELKSQNGMLTGDSDRLTKVQSQLKTAQQQLAESQQRVKTGQQTLQSVKAGHLTALESVKVGHSTTLKDLEAEHQQSRLTMLSKHATQMALSQGDQAATQEEIKRKVAAARQEDLERLNVLKKQTEEQVATARQEGIERLSVLKQQKEQQVTAAVKEGVDALNLLQRQQEEQATAASDKLAAVKDRAARRKTTAKAAAAVVQEKVRSLQEKVGTLEKDNSEQAVKIGRADEQEKEAIRYLQNLERGADQSLLEVAALKEQVRSLKSELDVDRKMHEQAAQHQQSMMLMQSVRPSGSQFGQFGHQPDLTAALQNMLQSRGGADVAPVGRHHQPDVQRSRPSIKEWTSAQSIAWLNTNGLGTNFCFASS